MRRSRARSERDLSDGRSATDRWRVVPQWDEASVTSSGETFCRVVGDAKREAKAKASPALLIPTPGARYDYMENLCDDNNKTTTRTTTTTPPATTTARRTCATPPDSHPATSLAACAECVCAPRQGEAA